MTGLVVWRLCKEEFAATAFEGTGAKLFGGRWSLPGLAAVYCSESRALAMLEVLAHVDEPGRLAGTRWVHISAHLPVDAVEKPSRVPNSWRKYPYDRETQVFGSTWLREQRSAALRLPSALIPGEFNYLLNPLHPHFDRIKIGPPEPYAFDPRLT